MKYIPGTDTAAIHSAMVAELASYTHEDEIQAFCDLYDDWIDDNLGDNPGTIEAMTVSRLENAGETGLLAEYNDARQIFKVFNARLQILDSVMQQVTDNPARDCPRLHERMTIIRKSRIAAQETMNRIRAYSLGWQ